MSNRNLPAVVSPQVQRTIELNNASRDLEKIEVDNAQDILAAAETMNLRSSGVLAGFLGGAVGSSAGVAISGLAFQGIALPAVIAGGPVGMVAGVALAILLWRGPRWWRTEKEIDRTGLVLAQIDKRIANSLTQIEALPTDAPDWIRNRAWEAHEHLVVERSEVERRIGKMHRT